jgi:SAM-dependent methyltransferase
VDPQFLAMIQCPACSAPGLSPSSVSLACGDCGREFERRNGFTDLLDLTQRGGEPTASTPEQRLMESELVARLYERFWRPAFVRVLAGGGAGAAIGGFSGEFFIHKNSLGLDDRTGPWLDLSCGPGLFARAIAASVPGSLVVGLDISRPMLKVAARRAKGYANIQLVRADAHSIPFADASFGGVNNTGALHAYDSPEQAFEEILRVLRPGGIYVGSTFSHKTSMLGRFAARVAGIRRFEPHKLRSQLSRIGFVDYEEIHLGDAFIFRARRP